MSINYRLIQKKDDKALAEIIKLALESQGNDVDGTVYTDEATNRMSTCYNDEKTIYLIVEENDILLGGAGIASVEGNSETAELQRMFLSPKGRGRGIGAELMKKSLNFAKEAGYSQVYIETFDNMKEAIKLYEKSGFKAIENRMGKTGHFYCTKLMLLKL